MTRSLAHTAATPAILIAFVAPHALAQWSATVLHPSAPGVTGSVARGVDGTTQVGQTYGTGGSRATVWTGSAASWVSVHPSACDASALYGISGNRFVGNCGDSGYETANIWTPEGLVSVGLLTGGYTRGCGVSGSTAVGVLNDSRAILWSGDPVAFTDLHPAGASSSYALAATETSQGGIAVFDGVNRAGMWHGTAESWVNLHPAGATTSQVSGMSGDVQVGFADLGTSHACLWRGSAASFVNLMPPGVYYSYATAAHGNVQVGTALHGDKHAALWQGTRESYVDLHQYLQPGYERSHALGVWTDGATIRVVGYGVPIGTQGAEALLWTYTPCPADLDNDGDFANGLTRDGAVTIEDLLSFLVGFEAGNVLVDLDNGTSTGTPDNAVDINDLLFFLARFEAGC